MDIRIRFNSWRETANYLRSLQLGRGEAVAILSRHGKTVFNEQHRLQAWEPDLDVLCKQGETDARKLRQVIASAQFPVPIRLSSDMRRARQTISPAPRGFRSTAIRVLRDFNYGDLGGWTFKGAGNDFETRNPDLYKLWEKSETRRTFVAPGGESWLGFEQRIKYGLTHTIMPKITGNIAFIVSHVGTTREILFSAFGGNISEWKPEIVATSITVIHFGVDNSPSLLLYNNTDHLNP